MRGLPLVALAVVLASCAGEPPHPESSTPLASPAPSASAAASGAFASARRLEADTTLETRAGASLYAPKGWWVTEDGDVILLEDPERALKAWFVETRERDAAKAVAAAWKRVAPGAPHASAGTLDTIPPSGGWDTISTISYETAGNGERVVEALARRHGDTMYVSLLDAERAAASRRAAQIERARQSLRPKGLSDESLAGVPPRPVDPARTKALDAFVQDALGRLEVPGAAVAIIQGNAVVYERAFGVRLLGKPQPITPSTLFLIGSITKSMTTMLQATLVDAGAFDWESPVVSVLPSFALGDAELTQKVVMWHMSCACTGMPRRDFEYIFEFANVSAEQRIASMKSMKPTTKLGETFQYSNLMVAAGGFAAAHAYAPKVSLGNAYDAAMKAKLFDPMGMKSTTLDFAVVQKRDHALPHATAIDGVVRPIPLSMERNVIPIEPAGGVWSNLRDMERYVMTEMAGGVAPNGKRVVSEKNLKVRHILRTGDPTTGGYGLGLEVGQYHGLPMLSHDGGAFGYGTSMFVLPEQRLGIIVLTNVRNGAPTEYLPFNAVVKRRVIEALFEGAKPLATTQLEYFTKGLDKATAKAVERVRKVTDSAQMKQLAGTYTNQDLGTLTLRFDEGAAILDAGEWNGAVGQGAGEHGPATLVFLDPPFAGSEFTVGGNDTNPTLSVTDGQVRYVFVRTTAR